MTFQEFTKTFKKQVDKISYSRQLDLSISICQKLFMEYQKFYEENNWGDPDILLDSIKLIKRSRTELPSSAMLEAQLQKIENITPDTEDFVEASFALNAAGAVYETIRFLLDRQNEHIYNIGMYLIDNVDAKLQGGDSLSEDVIDGHPLMMEARNYLLAETG